MKRTFVISDGTGKIADDAFANCEASERLYLKEGAEIDCLPENVVWDCVKMPQSQCNDIFGDEKDGPWGIITNGFFSGTEVQQPEFTFKKCDDECVRWIELKPREFQYVCSLAFEMPREECDEVVGRWLFTRSPKSGNLLLQLATAYMSGTEIEQDFAMALRCCEQACWCAIGNGIPFAAGERFPGVEIGGVDQSLDPEIDGEWIDLLERANRMKEEILTHFQRLDLRMFETVGEGNDRYYRIPDHVFEGRVDLRDVLLPDELRDKHVRIGRCAFARCPNLRSITVAGMSDGFALSRHANSFEDCNSLSDRIQYLPEGSKLMYCLNAPDDCPVCGHVREIADFAFTHSNRLRNFTWDYHDEGCDNVGESRKIGKRAFECCNELCMAEIGGRDISLGERAFAACSMLCAFRFAHDDSIAEDGVVPSFLDISAQGVFEGCETMLHIETPRGRGYLVVHEGSAGAQFSNCRELRDCPPIIATSMPPFLFESCAAIQEIKCVATSPDVIKDVVSGKRPGSNPGNGAFRILDRAFANCNSLERFNFCRLRVSLHKGYESEIDVVDDMPKQVLCGYEAFAGCSNLRQCESSFAGALEGSNSTAFSGCPDFEGFVED